MPARRRLALTPLSAHPRSCARPGPTASGGSPAATDPPRLSSRHQWPEEQTVVHPEYPPRVRIEWLIASARVVLAGGAMLAVAIDPLEHVHASILLYLLGCYLAYSLGMLTLVWAPVRFANGWDIAVHLFDFAAISVLIIVTQGATSPFFVYFLFLLVCATLRWGAAGTLWTASGTMLAYAGVVAYGMYAPAAPRLEVDTFVIRCVYLTVFTTLLWYLGLHQRRLRREIGRMAAWPRRLSRDPREVLAEVLSETAALLPAQTIVLAWEDANEHRLNLAWQSDGRVDWVFEACSAFTPLVAPRLEGTSFQVRDAAQDHGRVLILTPRGFLRCDCRPISEPLRARFAMQAVQSWPLEGDLIRGRMFRLNRSSMRMDDLMLGQLVAQLVLSRLEGLYALAHLRDSAALDERVRVARDLHDSLLQSQAGAALQLLAARRLLDRDPEAARSRLEEVQHQLESSELEMRCFIRELRPRPGFRQAPSDDLAARFADLRGKVERQWDVTVDMRLHDGIDQIPPALRDDVYRLAQEAIVNAARHAHASTIIMTLRVAGTELGLDVVDDGRGFPFHGTYDLADLNHMNQGPLTLRERVAALAGDLTLTSMNTGTALHMRLPLPQEVS